MQDDEISPAAPPPDWAARLLAFWFDDHGFDDWYGGGPEFDAAVRELAGEWREALRVLPAESFLTGPDTALAAVILFDQVPRNIHRHQAEAFATDDLARAIARGMVARGWDRNVPEARRQFVYLPFEHSEDIADQRESLRLMAGLADPRSLDYAKKHFDIIDRFGRFPHRNAALGRANRPGEEAAIEEGGNW
ncbi:DUF924 family protein [Sphingopyxis sp.]|uniref:DUF924 family protein n=1 Tax=Sphingopyxis sp. TaxID=1908224 RepID=UPI0035B102AE